MQRSQPTVYVTAPRSTSSLLEAERWLITQLGVRNRSYRLRACALTEIANGFCIIHGEHDQVQQLVEHILPHLNQESNASHDEAGHVFCFEIDQNLEATRNCCRSNVVSLALRNLVLDQYLDGKVTRETHILGMIQRFPERIVLNLFFGGKRLLGETSLETAIRETNEETNGAVFLGDEEKFSMQDKITYRSNAYHFFARK